MTEMIKSLVNGEFEIVLPAHRAERPEWYTEKGWEKDRLKSMSKNLGAGDVIYYVGGEEGEMVALCQIWGAETVVFEPNPKVWSHYPLIWEANKLDKPLACIPGFASSENNNLTRIYHNEFPPESNSVIEAAHGFKELHTEGSSYGQVTIDSCVYDHKIKPPTAITIDVEGSEWSVLAGAEKVLSDRKEKVWLTGHAGGNLINVSRDLLDVSYWLMELGYKETLLYYQHEVHLFYE